MTSAPKFNYPASCLVLCIGFVGSLFWAFGQPRLYEATATLEAVDLEKAEEGAKLMTMDVILDRVAERLRLSDNPNSLDENGSRNASIVVKKRLRQHLTVKASFAQRQITIRYRSHDRAAAALTTRVIVDEFLSFEARRQIDDEMVSIESLMTTYEEQKLALERAEHAVSTYRDQFPDRQAPELVTLLERQQYERQKLNLHLSELRRRGMHTGPVLIDYRVVQNPTPPASEDYLRAPIFQRIVIGAFLALSLGCVSAFFFRKASKQSSCSP